MADRRDLNASSNRTLDLLRFGALGFVLLLLVVLWVSAHAGASLDGAPAPASNPFQLVADLVAGRTKWTGSSTVIAVACTLCLGFVAVVVTRVATRSSRSSKRPDRAARFMASRKDLEHLTERGARAKADRLGVTAAEPGIPLGKALPWKSWLYSSWEDMVVVVAGPRTMKSTAYAIPGIMAAPGAVLATSNKRDVVDATRGPRSELGRVWVFDPQSVANEPGDWWWNPLTYIAAYDERSGRARRDPSTGWVVADEARAEKLAGQFCASAIVAGAKTDAYFDGEAENLIALMLLAAACGDEKLTKVYTWLATATDDTPIELLRDNGFELQAQSLFALAQLPDKQREGVYGTARARMGFLRHRDMVKWVTPPEHRARQFHPVEFAASTDTLYPLSREGEGSAGPLVAALTVAVIDALEERATASPGGRLAVPFVAILDEAANICRFRNLDSYYSHFGSRGIIIETILQNWAQGEEVWGVKGMEKLWSAANVKVYGGGVDDDRFLRRISDLIGTHTHIQTSESVSSGRGSQRGGVSVSRSVHERTILTIGELRELPQGRAVVFASGTPAVLLEPQPWFAGEHADKINVSIATHGPSAGPLVVVDDVPPTHRPAPADSPWNVKAIDQ